MFFSDLPALTQSQEDLVQLNLSKWNDSYDCLAPLTAEEHNLLDKISASKLVELVTDDDESPQEKPPFQFSQLTRWIEEEKLSAFMSSQNLNDFKSFLDQYQQSKERIKKILKIFESDASKLKEYMNFALEDIQSFLWTCEQICKEQERLDSQVKEIQHRMTYFSDVSMLSKKLSSTLLDSHPQMIIPVLKRIQEIAVYFDAKPEFYEVDTYRENLDLTLDTAVRICSNLINRLIDTANDNVYELVKKKKDETNDPLTLFYGEFRVQADEVKTISTQLQQSSSNLALCRSALAACRSHYFSVRRALILPSVEETLAAFVQQYPNDMSSLTRSCCNFLIRLCEDEISLHDAFFSKGCTTEELSGYLSTFCMRFQDTLRPRIVQITHLEILAELIHIMSTLVLSSYTVDDVGPYINTTVRLMEDIQERLTFRTVVYSKEQIRNYNPGPGDLSYPERLEMMKEISKSQLKKKHFSTHEPTSALLPIDLHGMWYPTLRRCIVCLTQIFRCLDNTIFQALSQEVLVDCIFSLIEASDRIVIRSSMLDGQLFLIKHLLLLREQLIPFNVDFALKESSLNFSKLKDAIVDFVMKKTEMFSLHNNAFMGLLLSGQQIFQESFIDFRREVDRKIKEVCEQLIEDNATRLLSPLKHFMSSINDHLVDDKVTDNGDIVNGLARETCAEAKPANTKLSSKLDSTRLDQARSSITEFYCQLLESVLFLKKAISLYIVNEETEIALFHPIKETVIEEYEKFIKFIEQNFESEDVSTLSYPSSEQVKSVLLSRDQIMDDNSKQSSTEIDGTDDIKLEERIDDTEESSKECQSGTHGNDNCIVHDDIKLEEQIDDTEKSSKECQSGTHGNDNCIVHDDIKLEEQIDDTEESSKECQSGTHGNDNYIVHDDIKLEEQIDDMEKSSKECQSGTHGNDNCIVHDDIKLGEQIDDREDSSKECQSGSEKSDSGNHVLHEVPNQLVSANQHAVQHSNCLDETNPEENMKIPVESNEGSVKETKRIL